MLAGRMYPKINAYKKHKICKNAKPLTTNKTHLLLFLLALIIAVNKIHTIKNKNSSLTVCTTAATDIEKIKQLDVLHSLSVGLQKRLTTRNIKFKQNQIHNALVILLLLLSNDVHPHPGPQPQPINEYIGIPLQCSTCHNWTEISEGKIKRLRDGGFEWICQNVPCSPNHQLFSHQALDVSPNRYNSLISIEDHGTCAASLKPPGKETAKLHKIVYPTNEEIENYKLLKELPKISSKEYVGKDLCRKCRKDVRVHHRAVLCDKCNTWIHLKCSDMTASIYNINKRKKSFKWICNVCRVPEEKPSKSKFSNDKCTPDQLPESWDELSKQVNRKLNEDIIIHLNAQSVVEKGDDIYEICTTLKPALIFLTETWLDESCPKGTAVPQGYTIIRKDRSEEFKQLYGKTSGGGAAVLVREGINMKKHTTLNKAENEILWCTLTINGIRHLIGLIYRAEYTNLLDIDDEGSTEIERLLQSTQDHNLILIGDTNCDTSTLTPSRSTQTLLKTTEEYGLQQQINKPTRFNDKTATTIDHIFIRNNDLIKKTGTCEGISDHCSIYCIISKDTEQKPDDLVRCRTFKNFDENMFREGIEKQIEDSNYKHHMMNKNLDSAFNTVNAHIFGHTNFRTFLFSDV